MDGEKSIRIITFNGDENAYRKWSKKFTSQAYMKGYAEVLLGVTEAPADIVKAETEEQIAARKANIKAYNELVLACEDDVSFDIMEQAISDKHPNGNAHEAWKLLKAKYEPDDGVSIISLKREFANSRLESETDDPEIWLIKLE